MAAGRRRIIRDQVSDDDHIRKTVCLERIRSDTSSCAPAYKRMNSNIYLTRVHDHLPSAVAFDHDQQQRRGFKSSSAHDQADQQKQRPDKQDSSAIALLRQKFRQLERSKEIMRAKLTTRTTTVLQQQQQPRNTIAAGSRAGAPCHTGGQPFSSASALTSTLSASVKQQKVMPRRDPDPAIAGAAFSASSSSSCSPDWNYLLSKSSQPPNMHPGSCRSGAMASSGFKGGVPFNSSPASYGCKSSHSCPPVTKAEPPESKMTQAINNRGFANFQGHTPKKIRVDQSCMMRSFNSSGSHNVHKEFSLVGRQTPMGFELRRNDQSAVAASLAHKVTKHDEMMQDAVETTLSLVGSSHACKVKPAEAAMVTCDISQHNIQQKGFLETSFVFSPRYAAVLPVEVDTTLHL